MPDAPGTMTSDRTLQTIQYGASRRPSMQAFGGVYGGGASSGGVRRTSLGAPPSGGASPGYQPGGSMGYPNPFGGANGPVTGQQYNRTNRTALPQGPFLEESMGIDPYGREFVQSSNINQGYVDPNLRFQLEHESRRREGESRDRLAEIRETGNQQRLTSGQEQGWTTGERVRGRGEYLEDDRRMFERLPGLWGMFTGEGAPATAGAPPTTGGVDRAMSPSMAAITGGAQGLTAGGVAGQSGAHGGINPGGGVAGTRSDGAPMKAGADPAAAGDSTADQASDLAFARAKDKAGLLAGARMKGARAALANSSLGTQARATNAILGDAASGLTDVATAQAIAEAQRAADVEDRNYAGGLTRRGQNMSLAPSILALLRGQGRAY